MTTKRPKKKPVTRREVVHLSPDPATLGVHAADDAEHAALSHPFIRGRNVGVRLRLFDGRELVTAAKNVRLRLRSRRREVHFIAYMPYAEGLTELYDGNGRGLCAIVLVFNTLDGTKHEVTVPAVDWQADIGAPTRRDAVLFELRVADFMPDAKEGTKP